MNESLNALINSIPRLDDWALTTALVEISSTDFDRLTPIAVSALQTLRAHIIAEMGGRTVQAYIEQYGDRTLPYN
jgi:hypothetical protein